jgi:MoaE-MoaD fusion protein
VTISAVVVHRDIADRLAVHDRDEEQIAPPGRPIELDAAPLLEAHVARIARNVSRGFDAYFVQSFRELRAVGQGHDLHFGRDAHRLGFECRELECEGFLSADDAVAAPLEVRLRLDVALHDLSLELGPTGLQCAAPEVREKCRADTAVSESGDNHEMGGCKLVGPRIDEAAAGGLSVETRNRIDERLVGDEVVPQILEPRRSPVGIGRGTHSDHYLEVGVGLRARDHKAGNSLNHGELLTGRWKRQPEGCATCEEVFDIAPPPGSGACAAIVVSTVVVVQVRVRLFAGLRERAGWSERELEGVERVSDVWAALDLGAEPPGLLYAVNREYAPAERELADGDEVALIPPVSGGASRLSAGPIDPAAVIAEVADERAGGIAVFIGTTRVQSRGRKVLHLDYEAYEGMAEQVMEELAADLQGTYELCAIAIAHRVGRVGIGEPSVVIAVSAPHRGDALAACKDCIDRLKKTVPLWKKEVYEGGEAWIGRGS